MKKGIERDIKTLVKIAKALYQMIQTRNMRVLAFSKPVFHTSGAPCARANHLVIICCKGSRGTLPARHGLDIRVAGSNVGDQESRHI